MYSEDRRVWNAIFEAAVRDLSEAQTNGIDIGGEDGAFFPIVLGNKGDWSYLDTWWLYPANVLLFQGFLRNILVPKRGQHLYAEHVQQPFIASTWFGRLKIFDQLYNKLQLRYPAEISNVLTDVLQKGLVMVTTELKGLDCVIFVCAVRALIGKTWILGIIDLNGFPSFMWVNFVLQDFLLVGSLKKL